MFLNWTASFSHIDEESGSKMDAHNLATVITPNILYVKQKDGSQVQEHGDTYFLSIESVNTLIEDQDMFAEVPQDVMEILETTNLAHNADVTTKDIVARVDAWLRGGGGSQTSLSQTSTRASEPEQSEASKPVRPPTLRINTSEVPNRGGQEASIKRVNAGGDSPVTTPEDSPM